MCIDGGRGTLRAIELSAPIAWRSLWSGERGSGTCLIVNDGGSVHGRFPGTKPAFARLGDKCDKLSFDARRIKAVPGILPGTAGQMDASSWLAPNRLRSDITRLRTGPGMGSIPQKAPRGLLHALWSNVSNR